LSIFQGVSTASFAAIPDAMDEESAKLCHNQANDFKSIKR
jgi:hypothetical protein